MQSELLTYSPDPPEHLPREAWEDWYRVTDELIRAGHNRPVYLDAVEMYCRSLYLERQAFNEATAAGLVYQVKGKGANGKEQSKPHPVWRVYLQVQAQTRRLARSLMLTPQDNQPAKGKRTAVRRKGSGGMAVRRT